jgi:hypothetical protein
MKLLRILSLFAALGLMAAGLNAASNETDNIVRLPVFRVDAPRHSEAERAIARSLHEVAARASIPISVRPEVPVIRDAKTEQPAVPLPVRLAKF